MLHAFVSVCGVWWHRLTAGTEAYSPSGLYGGANASRAVVEVALKCRTQAWGLKQQQLRSRFKITYVTFGLIPLFMELKALSISLFFLCTIWKMSVRGLLIDLQVAQVK